MKAHQTDFGNGSIYKNILEMAIPMTIAQLINLLYNMVDRMYIGRISGTGAMALTGLGLCFPIITIISAFANLYGMGGAPLCSIERGRGNNDKAEEIMGNSFFLLIISGMLLTIIGLIFYKPILYAFGASVDTFPHARDYLIIYLIGNVFSMISLGMNGFLNSQGFGQTAMLTIILGALSNIILDPIFIFVLNMGVKGAAIETIISQFLSALWVFKFLTSKKAILKLKYKYIKLNIKIVKKIIMLGLSGFIMAITSSGTLIVCNASLQFYGGDLYVGVMTILNSIREILSMPASGLTSGATPVISYNYGAKNYDKVKKAIYFISFGSFLYIILIWIVVIIYPKVFILIFNNDPPLVEASISSIRLYFFGFFMIALQMAGQSVFVSLGKARNAIFFSIFRKVIIVIPLTIILPKLFNLGVNGVFLAEVISNFIGGGACFITMILTVIPELTRKKLSKLEKII